MQLSEAIREGCKTTKPFVYGFIKFSEQHGICASTLGAALIAVDPDFSQQYKLWEGMGIGDATKENLMVLRLSGFFPELSTTLISVLEIEESRKMTREQIANWLENRGY